MAEYRAVPPEDPFAVSRTMSGALADELGGPAAAGLTACELEELLAEETRKVVLQLEQDYYDLRALREERQAREQRAPAAGTGGITRTRLETGHGRLLATLSGTVTVTRCAWRKPGAPGYRPADAALSLPAGRHSRTLAKLAALEAARGSFDDAHDAIARRCGPVIGKRQTEESVVHSAADIPAFCAARIPEPCTPSMLVVLSSDGKVISSPDLGVSAVAAAGVCVLFPAWWTHYLNSVSTAVPVRTSFSLLFLELNGYCVNAVQLHVNAADVLVRRGKDGDGPR
jgi:hypothetical protein